jgi:hypothetical protein
MGGVLSPCIGEVKGVSEVAEGIYCCLIVMVCRGSVEWVFSEVEVA